MTSTTMANADTARVGELLGEASMLAETEARREGEVLLGAVLGKPRSYLYAWPDAEVDEVAANRYRSLLAERARGIPVAYLLGTREFWSLPLAVDPSTLIPRHETERLVELVLAHAPASAELAIADLGTGTGAVALAVASERPRWQVTGVELSDGAFALAQRNRETLALENVCFLQGSWFEPLGAQRFDVIVANPPYLAESDPHLEEGDLPYEPRLALVSGVDGLDDIRHIVDRAPHSMTTGAGLFLEHGYAQGEAVRTLLHSRGFEAVRTHRDDAGHERVSTGLWTREVPARTDVGPAKDA